MSSSNLEEITLIAHDWEVAEIDDHIYIYISGRTVEGKSVCVRVDGFFIFVYIEFPGYMGQITPNQAQKIFYKICSFMGENQPIGYSLQKKRKIQTNALGYYLQMKFKCSKDCDIFCYSVVPTSFKNYKIHEQNIDLLIKYTSIRKLDCAGWIKAISYIPYNFEELEPFSGYDITLYAKWNKIFKVEQKEVIQVKNVIASFDIECQSINYNSKIPKPEIKGNKIFQIAVTFAHHGDNKENFKPYLLTLYSCPKIGKSKERDVEVKVLNYESEEDLLLGFMELINRKNPDILIGYNTHKFDWPYMITRAQLFGIFRRWSSMSRVDEVDSSEIEIKWSSSAYKEQKFKLLNLPGIFTLDLMIDIERNYKFDSYSLNNISSSLLGLTKKDLSPKQLFVLCDLSIALEKYRKKGISEAEIKEIQNIVGNAISDDQVVDDDGEFNILHKTKKAVLEKLTVENAGELLGKLTIGYIGKYCVWDTYLPLLIMQKLNTLEGLRQMSNITCVPMDWLQLIGQQIKVVSQ
ncbi:MAG: hypothetical protein DRP08_05705, partial [Candidatus Aenigmatarchaeota archaeon]